MSDKVCIVDNKTCFEAEQPYTVKCEACNLWCKIFKYRSCEDRFEWNAQQGIDVFKDVKEIERLSNSQQGIGGKSIQKPGEKSTKKPTRRGR